MPVVMTAWRNGFKGRVPVEEEQAVRSMDTTEQLIEVPCGMTVDGIGYVVVWREDATRDVWQSSFTSRPRQAVNGWLG